MSGDRKISPDTRNAAPNSTTASHAYDIVNSVSSSRSYDAVGSATSIYGFGDSATAPLYASNSNRATSIGDSRHDPDLAALIAKRGLTSSLAKALEPREVARELDLGDYIVADFAFPATFKALVTRGTPVIQSMKDGDYSLRIFPDSIVPGHTSIWECNMISPVSKSLDTPTYRSSFDGRAMFFRDTKLISVTSSHGGGFWMLLAPVGWDLKLDDYVIEYTSFPDHCPIIADGSDKGRDANDDMKLRGYSIGIFPGRIAFELLHSVDRRCKVRWPIGSGLFCISHCQAVFDYSSGDIHITTDIGDGLCISMRRKTG